MPHRLAVRDFAGLRLHLARLAAAGHDVTLWPGSVVGTDDATVLRAKIGYTAFQAHLGELVIRLGESHGLDEDAAWRTVRAVVDETYAGAGRARGAGPRRVHRADRAAQGPGADAPGRRRRQVPAGAEPAACARLSTSSAGAARRCRAPVCAYVYDTAALRARAAAVRAALPPGTTLLYAVKANGHPAVVRTLAAACDGLEVASGGELDLAVAAGARRIVVRRARPRPTPSWPRPWPPGALVNVESGARAAPPGPGRPGGRDRRGRRRYGSTAPGPRCRAATP